MRLRRSFLQGCGIDSQVNANISRTLVEKVHIRDDNIHDALVCSGTDAREDSSSKKRAVRSGSRLPDTCANVDQGADQKSVSSSEYLIAWDNDEVGIAESNGCHSCLPVQAEWLVSWL
jgi:hypothetical protein